MNRKGFTLIELMVVVLIVGILSSIALPQYQKAIKKARATEAITVGKKILEAEKVYFLENQEYTSDLSKLRVAFPQMKNWTVAGVSAVNNSAYPFVNVAFTGLNNMSNTALVFTSEGRLGELFNNELYESNPIVTCVNIQPPDDCLRVLPCAPNVKRDPGNLPYCTL